MAKPKPSPPRPTDAELTILRVLWRKGPSTVRDVQEELALVQPTGYTTALKLLQIMAEKGLVDRDDSRRTHIYRASRPEEATQRQLVGDLLERAFGGSAQCLVMQALASKPVPAEELTAIREWLDRLEGGES